MVDEKADTKAVCDLVSGPIDELEHDADIFEVVPFCSIAKLHVGRKFRATECRLQTNFINISYPLMS